MSPRVAGAALALLAAVLLVASIAGTPAGWWAGHPLRNGEAMHKKDVDVSLIRAVGCNTGGDGTCEPLEMSGGFDTLRYVELGASGILALGCLLLAGVTLAGSERRKRFGLLVIGLSVACAVLAGALILMPKMKAAGIELPMGAGLFMFFGGIACACLGSILAMRPTPKLELQPPRQSYAPGLGAPPTAQPVDVLAMLQPAPRPPAPDPARPPPSPGGQLAGPAGPLAPPPRSAPYTVPTAPPFAPPEHAPTVLPPTPFPAPPSPFSPRGGAPPLSMPPPPDGRPRTGSAAPLLPGSKASRPMPAIPADRTKASSSMPAIPGDRSKASSPLPANPGDRPSPPTPARAKPASIAPPTAAEARTKAASIAPPINMARPKGTSVPPPSANARAKPASIPPPGPRDKPPSIAPVPSTVAGLIPPLRTKGATGLPPPRAKGPSVPPPGAPKPTTVSAIVPPPPAGPILPTMLPIRADTDTSDALETTDRDAMTMMRDGAPAVSVGRPTTDASIGENTDASVPLSERAAVEERTDLAAQVIEPRDSSSDIQTSMQRKLTQSELVRAVARESQSEIETIAREKISSRDLSIGDSTSPAVLPEASRAELGRRSAQEILELGEAQTQPARINISTASQSLPPPKKPDVVATGPTPACPQCEAPMAWVEEHLRFYCKSCRMYF